MEGQREELPLFQQIEVETSWDFPIGTGQRKYLDSHCEKTTYFDGFPVSAQHRLYRLYTVWSSGGETQPMWHTSCPVLNKIALNIWNFSGKAFKIEDDSSSLHVRLQLSQISMPFTVNVCVLVL